MADESIGSIVFRPASP
jgi:hypothetical protein